MRFCFHFLLRHGPTVYNGHFRGPVTLTPVAERLAVEMSQPVFTTQVCRDRGSNPDLPHARWTLYLCATAAFVQNKNKCHQWTTISPQKAPCVENNINVNSNQPSAPKRPNVNKKKINSYRPSVPKRHPVYKTTLKLTVMISSPQKAPCVQNNININIF